MSVIIFIIGILMGFVLQSTLMAKHIKGNLRLRSDGEDAYLFVELNTTVDKLAGYKVVTFKVEQDDWSSLI